MKRPEALLAFRRVLTPSAAADLVTSASTPLRRVGGVYRSALLKLGPVTLELRGELLDLDVALLELGALSLTLRPPTLRRFPMPRGGSSVRLRGLEMTRCRVAVHNAKLPPRLPQALPNAFDRSQRHLCPAPGDRVVDASRVGIRSQLERRPPVSKRRGPDTRTPHVVEERIGIHATRISGFPLRKP